MIRKSLRSLLGATLASATLASHAYASPFAYVGDFNAPYNVAIYDVATNARVDTICCAPFSGIAISPDGSRVYLTDGGNVRVVDGSTHAFLTSIAMGGQVQGIAINSTGTRVYVANRGLNRVDVIDTSSNSVIANAPASGVWGIIVSPDNSRVYTGNFFSDTVTVIDTTTNSVVTTISLPASSGPRELAMTLNGTKLFVGMFNTYSVAVIDPATNTYTGSIGTGCSPHSMVLHPSGNPLYVSHDCADYVSILDTTTSTVTDSIPVSANAGIAITPDGSRLWTARGNVPYALNVIDTSTHAIVTTFTDLRPQSHGAFIGPFCPSGCNYGNGCTTDSCNMVSSCSHSNVTSGTSCDDGLYCNGPDTCDGSGGCTNHGTNPCAGGPECAATCDEAADDCFDPVSTACTSDGNVCTDDHCDGGGTCVHSPNAAPCDDGLFCNGADTCAGGSCTHAGDPCAAGPECAAVCNEGADNCFDPAGTACTADANPCTLDQCDGTGACGHPAGNAGAVCRPSADQCDATETCTGASTTCPPDGAVPNGTACTDGDPCTTGEVCTAGACGGGILAPEGCVDHYLCYKSKVTSGTAHFVAIPGTDLADGLETVSATVQKPKAICPPADKNGEGIHDAATHEESYQIKSDVNHVPHTNLIVRDQFGTLQVDTVKVERLFVPTAKALGSAPAGPPAPGAADHYKCFRVKLSLNAPKFPKGMQATVADQFQTRLYDVRSPRHLCVPVDKNGEGIEHPLAHLMCYQVKPAQGQPKHVRVVGQINTDNQFGTGRLDTIKEDALCVPATRTP